MGEVGPAVEPRLHARRRDPVTPYRRRQRRLATEHQRDPGTKAQYRVHQTAKRNPCAIVFAITLLVIVVIIVSAVARAFVARRTTPQQARGAGEGDQCCDAEDDGGHQAVKSGERSSEKHRRHPQHHVTDDTTETRRQRPVGPARQTRRKRSSEDGAKQPRQHAQSFAAERPVAEQPIAPNTDRQEQRQRAQTQQLHHQIGSDRAGPAEQIVDTRIRGMAE